MDNTQSARKTKLLIRITGSIFVIFGLINFFSDLARWFTTGVITFTWAQSIYLLMLIGGGFLFTFRQDGLEMVFVILRLYVLLGSGGIIGGLIAIQFSIILWGVGILVLAIGLMVFLSQDNVKSMFIKK